MRLLQVQKMDATEVFEIDLYKFQKYEMIIKKTFISPPCKGSNICSVAHKYSFLKWILYNNNTADSTFNLMQNARKLNIQNWMQHALFKQSRQRLMHI